MRRIDFLDLRMMDGLGNYGPRNISGLARKLKVPPETLRKRMIRIRPKIYLGTNVYCSNLGLMKAVVHAEAVPGHEQLLFDCLKANDFWMYVNRCYGMNEGVIGFYALPKKHASDFRHFVAELKKLKATRNTRLYWSTCWQAVNARVNWYDRKNQKWVFRWNEWINEVPKEKTELPKTLVDPEDYPILADDTDLFILRELEKDPTISLTRVASMMGISQQLAEYHYLRHVMDRGLVEGFDVTDFRFNMEGSDMFYFFLTFETPQQLSKFASSVMDKPFTLGLGKVLGENTLIAHVYLPKLEFRNFVDALSKLINMRLLQTYSYVIQDLAKTQRQTISYEHFKEGSWTYNHQKHIKKLEELTKGHTPKKIIADGGAD